LGGSGKAEGFADGEGANHWQAARPYHNWYVGPFWFIGPSVLT